MRKVCLVMLLAFVAGCAFGPEYRRPSVEMPAGWRFKEDTARAMANPAWWEQFDDPVLDELIDAALAGNDDLKIATARMDEYVGRYLVTRAPLFPQASAYADASRQRLSRKGAVPVPPTVKTPASLFGASVFASWEIDLWGKIRRLSEAARADLFATQEARSGLVLSLVAAVADGYVNLRSLDKQLAIAKSTVHARAQSWHIFELRFRQGLVSELELYQAKSEYEQALAVVPALRKAIAQQENALCVLLGRNPGPIPRGKSIDALVFPAVPEGLPSQLLENRPDIRQAEQELVAAHARIGAARALYFPEISLTGMFGWSSTKLTTLFSGPARAWTWSAPVAQPLFTMGAIAGEVRQTRAVEQEALYRYRQAVQNAFRDVEDALVDQKFSREQFEVARIQVATLHQYVRAARLRYESGYADYLNVLDAERSLFDAQLEYVRTRQALFEALVNVYKAMGGGWK